jgi:hypothetical protein
MGGQRVPGVLGVDQATSVDTNGGAISPTATNNFAPGPVGNDDTDPVPLDTTPTIKAVVKDWDPLPPLTPTEVPVGGTTIAAVADALNKRDEWGQGGGIISNEAPPRDYNGEVTIKLHLTLIMRLPKWSGYVAASPAAKAEWDQMIVKLRAHEERHVAIAVEVADELANSLVGEKITQLVKMVNASGPTLVARHKAFDDETDHGAKPNVPYGDVSLDTTVV